MMKQVSILLSAAACVCTLQAYTSGAFVMIPKRRGVTTISSSLESAMMNTRLYLHSSVDNEKGGNVDNHNKRSRNTHPQITTIQGLDSFLDFLAESDDRIVIVEFYAAWCKS